MRQLTPLTSNTSDRSYIKMMFADDDDDDDDDDDTCIFCSGF